MKTLRETCESLITEAKKKKYFPTDKKELLDLVNKRINNAVKKHHYDINLNDIDTSKITDMAYLFATKEDIQKLDISEWDVSNVTDMTCMFMGSEFGGDISKWDVSKVENMREMFKQANYFNCDISGWDVSNVKDMRGMFSRTERFNQDLSKWNVTITDKSDLDWTFYNSKLDRNPPEWYKKITSEK